MQNYLNLLSEILEHGEPHEDRTGVGTKSLFGRSLTFDLNDGATFPLMTTKFVPLRIVFEELKWFLSGSTDIRDLWKKNVHIWDDNYEADYWRGTNYHQDFSLGHVYGAQWRSWNKIGDDMFRELDQICNLLEDLHEDPFSRRHIVTAWNPSDLNYMCLPACHIMWHVKVHPGMAMSMAVYMRSIDTFLGLPYNIASYALLLLMLCRVLGRQARSVTFFLGDVHLYLTHLEQANLQLARAPFSSPVLQVPVKDPSAAPLTALLSYAWEDLWLQNYSHHPAIKAPMAV